MSTSTRVCVVFHSLWGHVFQLASAVADGARAVRGVEVMLCQIPELDSAEKLEKLGSSQAKAQFANVPTADLETLASADAIIFGVPTRFGHPTYQMSAFLESLVKEAGSTLSGKVVGAFTCSQTQHGGQELTILSMLPAFSRLGMVFAGVPPTCNALKDVTTMHGGSVFGASSVAPPKQAKITEIESQIAEAQGRFAAELAVKLHDA